MASGAPDFTNYTRPNRTIIGEGQSRYVYFDSEEVAADGASLWFNISPEEGEILNVALISFRAQKSGYQPWFIYIDADRHIRGSFDLEGFFPFPESAAMVAVYGETVHCSVSNYEREANTLSMCVGGTTEEV